MGWSERHAFFERIVALRERYARAASGDERTGVLSVADAMLYAEAVMIAVELDDEPWLDEPEAAVAGVGEPAPIDGTPRRPGETGDRARRRRLGDRGRD